LPIEAASDYIVGGANAGGDYAMEDDDIGADYFQFDSSDAGSDYSASAGGKAASRKNKAKGAPKKKHLM
jgi:hypothetical protein